MIGGVGRALGCGGVKQEFCFYLAFYRFVFCVHLPKIYMRAASWGIEGLREVRKMCDVKVWGVAFRKRAGVNARAQQRSPLGFSFEKKTAQRASLLSREL